MKTWIGLVALIALGGVGYGVATYHDDPGWQTTKASGAGLTRTYYGKALVSDAYPDARIAFEGATYHGGQQFILYGTVQVEQYFFTREASENGARQVIVMQFEEVLPGIEGAYDYSAAPEERTIAGLTFHIDQAPSKTHWFWRKGKPGTDGYRQRQFLAANDIAVPDDYLWSRWAYVPEDAPRNEMLILVNEDLAPAGHDKESLLADPQARAVYEAHLIERFAEVIRIERD